MYTNLLFLSFPYNSDVHVGYSLRVIIVARRCMTNESYPFFAVRIFKRHEKTKMGWRATFFKSPNLHNIDIGVLCNAFASPISFRWCHMLEWLMTPYQHVHARFSNNKSLLQFISLNRKFIYVVSYNLMN